MAPSPLRILVSGSEQSGKSTLVGRLLYKCGQLSAETMDTLRKQKVEEGKSYRQLLQTLQVEERGATPERRFYKSPKYEVIIADPPSRGGIFYGRRKVECLLFMVSAAKREFETGWTQTQKQITAACKLQVRQFVVCINKMDSSTPEPYNCHRYKDIIGKVSDWLSMCDRDPRTVLFFPISALYGDNLHESSIKMLWFRRWEIARERRGPATGTTLQQFLDVLALPPLHLREGLLFAPLGWTEKEEKALLRTWRSLSLQAPDHIPSPSMMSLALRQAGVWRSAEQCRSKVDALLRRYMADVLRGGIGCFPFYWELHDILGYDVSTAAFQLRQFKQEPVPTANATTAPDLGWAEDVFVLLGPSGQGALAVPKEGEKEEELVIPGPSGQEEPVAPEEAELVRSGHFDQGEPVAPEEGEEAEFVLLGHFGQGELVFPEEGEEVELILPGHFGQVELVFPVEGEEADLFHPQHFGQGEPVVPEEGEEAEHVLLGHFGQGEPVVPEEGEEAQLVHPGHFAQGEPVVPEEGEEAELVHPGHFGQGEPVVQEEGEEAELVHPQHFGQGELVPEEGEEAELVHPGHFAQGEPVVQEEGEEAELVHPQHFGQGQPVVQEEGEEAELVHPQHFGQGEPVVQEEGEEAELVHPGHFGQGEPVVQEEGEEAELVHPQHFGQGEPVVQEEGEEAELVHPQHFGQGEPVVQEEGEEAELVHPGHFAQGEPVVQEEGEEAELVHPGHFGQGEPVVQEEGEEAELVHPQHFGQGEPVVQEEGEEAEHAHPGSSGQGEPIVPEVAQRLVNAGVLSQEQVANLVHLCSQGKPATFPEEGEALPGSSGQVPYSETKSTLKSRSLDTPDSAESTLCPRPPKSPRCHPRSGRLGRSSGYKLCLVPPRTTRYEVPPRFSRSFKPDPNPGLSTSSSGQDPCPGTSRYSRPDSHPGPSTSSSGQDPCPGTSRNSRPDSHPGPSTSSSRLELHPRPSGSSGHSLPGAGLESRPGSPILLSSPEPEEEEEDPCSSGVPTQPPSTMASRENLIGPPLYQYPTPGLPVLLPSPFPFPYPLPLAHFQQGPSFPLPDPVYQMPLLGEASWGPVSPPLQSPPASFPLQDPPTQQAQSPPYSPPFQQPPDQAMLFFSQHFGPPGSFHAPPGPEGHFVFPPPGTHVFPNPSPQTPYPAQDFPRAFARSWPFSLCSFPWHGTSAYPLGIRVVLEPTSWPRRVRHRKPLPLPQPSKPESLLPRPPPVKSPPLPPRPSALVGPDPDGVEAPSSAAYLAPKPTSQPGSPSSSPPRALAQTPRQPPSLIIGPLPLLTSQTAPSGAGDQATRLPPPTLPTASSLPSGSPPQPPGPPSQPGSPGSPTSRLRPNAPPRLFIAPPPLSPILPPLSPFPLPTVPGAPDTLGNRPPPLAATPHPHGAPRPATASLQQSLVPMFPPGHSPLSPPKPQSPSPTSPSSPL